MTSLSTLSLSLFSLSSPTSSVDPLNMEGTVESDGVERGSGGMRETQFEAV